MTTCRIIYSGDAYDEEQRKVHFEGDFTDTIREVFKAHRLHLGISLQQLGMFLKINWSTIRKWESGKTRCCHAKHISRVNAFLNHEYDARLGLLRKSENSLRDIMERVPLELQECLQQAWVVFGVCCCYQGEEERFLRDLGDTLDSVSKKLLGECIVGKLGMSDFRACVAEEMADYSTDLPAVKKKK